MRTAAIAAVVLIAGVALADSPNAGPTDPLAGLHDASPRKRLEAAWSLAGLRTPAAEAAWTAALRDPARAELHFEAAARLAAFEKVGDDARKALAALAAEDRPVGLAAAVALRQTDDAQGAIDVVGVKPPGELPLGVKPTRQPAESAPTAFDAASLDGTVWTERSPVNILGEGSITYVALRRAGDGVVARVVTADRRCTRGPAQPGTHDRVWTTKWTLTTAWIDPATRAWIGSGRRFPERDGAPVGLVHGGLVVPAIQRTKDRAWTLRSSRGAWTYQFDGDLVAGKSGMVDVTLAPPGGPCVVGSARWRVEAADGGPVLHLDAAMPWNGGTHSIAPNEFSIDTATGAGTALGSPFDASTVYAFAGRSTAIAK